MTAFEADVTSVLGSYSKLK